MQKQNQDVGRKLGTATACMFTLPIIAFYLGLNVLFTEKEHPDNWAGGLAILVTNIVVFGYCYSAFQEPDDEPENDEDGPRVGIFKKRTD
jgi:VMA21-like domain